MFSKRQQQIIETAIKIIAKNGIQNLTTKNLANEIGISEPALYRHFNNKREILEGIIKYFKIMMNPAFDKMEEAEKPIQQIEIFVVTLLKILNSNCDCARVIFSESNFQNEEVLINSINIMMNKSQQKLIAIIAKGQELKEIQAGVSSLNISRIIIGSIRFIVVQWTMSGMIFNLETEGKQFWSDLRKIIKVN